MEVHRETLGFGGYSEHGRRGLWCPFAIPALLAVQLSQLVAPHLQEPWAVAASWAAVAAQQQWLLLPPPPLHLHSCCKHVVHSFRPLPSTCLKADTIACHAAVGSLLWPWGVLATGPVSGRLFSIVSLTAFLGKTCSTQVAPVAGLRGGGDFFTSCTAAGLLATTPTKPFGISY